MPISVGGIELHMGPSSVGGPDDLDAAIRGFIDRAKHSLAIAVQEIDSKDIARAIIAAKARGVNVRVILEGDYLTETKAVDDPWLKPGEHDVNREIVSAMLKARVRVITDLNPAIFHQKFIVRDEGERGAGVLTGSTNFTLTDTGTNDAAHGGGTGGVTGQNLNHVVILRGQKSAAQYLREFERMWTGTFGALSERVQPRPSEFGLPKVRVKPLFAPRHGPEMEIMKQMLKSTERIDFAMFTFSQSSGIDDTMIRLRPSLDVLRGVLDRDQGAAKWAATTGLGAAGVELHANRRGTGVRKLHHKLMVIDRRLLILGSFNYTDPANTLNDENILVIGDLEEQDPVAEAQQRELAAYALAEIDRIIVDLSAPVPAPIVPVP
ncbi:phospholipase D-like domain-containing protein [Agromyces larvae]|uniref:phospholipase D n=1 Tax=Agromyces larvae TaxID=2929802 RepID=A0ABY4BW95_9MICO|nr:phospholipase D-like domain-containing protein [Agromyces larvae]UOE43491.1 phospholipase D-like domain-containing protein [Agromyces larvae]